MKKIVLIALCLLIAAGCVLLIALGFVLSHGLDAPIGSVARFGVSLTAIAIIAPTIISRIVPSPVAA